MLAGDKYKLFLCTLRKEKREIIMDNTQILDDSIEKLFEVIEKDIPLILTFTGNGILSKDGKITEKDFLLQKYFPATKRDDFCCSISDYNEHFGFSICRVSTINSVVEKLNELKLPVVGIDIGPYGLSNLWRYNLIKEKSIPVHDNILGYNETENSFIFSQGNDFKTSSLNLIGQEVGIEFIPAFNVAISFLIDRSNACNFVGNIPSIINTDIIYKQIVDRTKYYVLVAVFLILGINFVFFETYRNKDRKISDQISLSKPLLVKKDSLLGILKAQDKFYKSQTKNMTYYSQMLDEIAATVPKNIKLNVLKINPLMSKIQRREQLFFDEIIIIEGFASSSFLLNTWESKLGELKWIKNTKLVSFTQEDNTDRGFFLMEVNILND